MPERPASMDLDHEAAQGTLDGARDELVADAQAVRGQTVEPKAGLTEAAGQMNARADTLDDQAEASHAESVRDLAVGLEKGSHQMLTRLLTRGGEVERATLANNKTLQENQKANVYSAEYLGMAPVVTKISKEDRYGVDEAEDETLNEHRMLHQYGGKSNILGAGGRLAGQRGFIMEKARHGDLSKVKEKTDALPPAQKMQVWRQLMAGGFKGLDQFHDQGMIHGDVKNQNFLLGADLTPKLMDLGTSTPVGEGMGTGTKGYIAPELTVGGVTSQAGDVWSMGESLLMALFGMSSSDFALEGEPPRGEDAPPVTKAEVLAEEVRTEHGTEPKWLAKVRAKARGLPDADVFMDFISKVMKLDPAERLTAKAALRHDFLKLKLKARAQAKARLAKTLEG